MKKTWLVCLTICSVLAQAVFPISASDEIGIVYEETYEESDLGYVDNGSDSHDDGSTEEIMESLEAYYDDSLLDASSSAEEEMPEIDAVPVTEGAVEENAVETAEEALDEEEFETEEEFPEDALLNAEDEEIFEINEFLPEEKEPLAGESWGTNLKWSLSNGVLTITGRGLMSACDNLDEDFAEKETNLFPWGDKIDSIRKVVIGDEVTSISPAAFFGCEKLEEVIIGRSVWEIGEQAFRNAPLLRTVTFNETKEEKQYLSNFELVGKLDYLPALKIGKWAFDSCESIKELTLPRKTIEIGEGAFDGCFSLEKIYLGKRLQTLGYEAFSGCASLKRVDLPKSLIRLGDKAFESCCEFSKGDAYSEDDYLEIHFKGHFPEIVDEDGVTVSAASGSLFSSDLIDLYYPRDDNTFTDAMKSNSGFAGAIDVHWVPYDDNMVVVSLGDSYSSGEGIEPFYGQYKDIRQKVDDFDWLAHRSALSWPGKLRVPGSDPEKTDETVKLKTYKYDEKIYRDPFAQYENCKWYFKASSGAVAENLTTTKQEKEVRNKGYNNHKELPRELPVQFDVFDQINEDVDYVTLTIGGNDVKFADIITNCVLEPTYLTGSAILQHRINKLWDNIDATKNNIRDVYLGIKGRTSSDTNVIVAGYPQLLDPSGKGATISFWEANYVNLNVSKFNNVLRDLVKECQSEMNIYFVDVEEKFKTHAAYSKDAWINEIIPFSQEQDLKDNLAASAYSIHPNEKGAEAYAACVDELIEKLEEMRD